MPTWKLLSSGLFTCFLGFGTCPPEPQPLGLALQKMGLVEMRSPRQIWPVGTIVGIKRDQWGDITEVPDICNPLLISPSIVQVGISYMRERTAQVSELEDVSSSGELELNGVSIDDVKARVGASGTFISGISVEISNASILYADATTLSKTASVLMKDETCRENIKKYEDQGFTVTSLDKVLVADLSYSILLNGQMDGNARISLLKQVGGVLGLSYDEASQTLVSGSALTFGFSVAPVSPIPQ